MGAGVLLATGVSAVLHALLPAPAMAAWGWRAAFVFGGLLGGLGWLLRRGLAESPVYLALARAGREERAPVRAVLRERLVEPPPDGGLWTGPKVAAWLSARLDRTVSRSPSALSPSPAQAGAQSC